METEVHSRFVRFEVLANDHEDALLRLIADAQRFGFGLNAVDSEQRPGTGETRIGVTLRVPNDVDCEALAQRFARHPTVVRVSPLGAADQRPRLIAV